MDYLIYFSGQLPERGPSVIPIFTDEEAEMQVESSSPETGTLVSLT